MSEIRLSIELLIIDKYLKANLLENLGNDEKRYEYLASTVASLQEKLENSPHLIIQFSLVAFQPHPNSNEPEIISIYEALKQHWKLIDNVYSQDKPIKLLQAIMLETISRVCDSDGRFASIVYHASAGAFPHHKYSLQESPIVKQVITTAAVKAEKFAATHYPSSTVAKEKVDFTVMITAPKNIAVDRNYLQQKLMAATGPTNEQGQPLDPPANPYTQANHGVIN
jgi:GTPase-associated system helical domain